MARPNYGRLMAEEKHNAAQYFSEADIKELAPEVDIPPLHELKTSDPETYKQLRDGFLGRFMSHDKRAAGSSPFNRGG